ncbi:hypothetical protein JCM10213_006027 [Rhodosporidiobolus nylandii]
MPRQRPAPIAVPPLLAKPAYQADLLTPTSAYLTPPSPGPSPNRLGNFVLRLKKSANHLRPVASPQHSPLLSPSLFPPPPSRDEDKENAPPFANLAPRSPRIASTGPWLDLPASPLLPPLSASSSSSGSSSGWPLTPDTPYISPKEQYSPSRHSKQDLVFPHRPRVRPTSALLTPEEMLAMEQPLASSAPPAPRLKVIPLPFPPPPPSSPHRRSFQPELAPRTPPRKPTRNPPTPPSSDKAKRLSLAASPVSPVQLSPARSNSLKIQVPPPTPPPCTPPPNRPPPQQQRLLHPYADYQQPPTAPNPKRIFSTFPSLSQAKGPVYPFPHGATRPRTPPPATASRSSTFSTLPSSDPDSDNPSCESPHTSPASSGRREDDGDCSDADSDCSFYPQTPPSLFLIAPVPPPRPPRSPLRPTSKPLVLRTPEIQALRYAPTATLVDEEDGDGEVSDAESSVEAPAFSSCPSTPSRSPRRGRALPLTDSPPVPPLPAKHLDEQQQLPRTVPAAELYNFLGLPSSSYSTVQQIRAQPRNSLLAASARSAQPEEEDVLVDLDFATGGFDGLPEEVRDARLSFIADEEETGELEAMLQGQKEKQEEQDGFDEELVLRAMEKMLWG